MPEARAAATLAALAAELAAQAARLETPVPSPCRNVCRMDAASGYCEGCLRTTSEIARWSQMNDDERLHLMEVVLPRREAQRV